MQTGYEMYRKSQLIEAAATFEKSAQTFDQSGDPAEVAHARFWVAYCALEGLDTHRGLGLLNDLARLCMRRNYRWLLMKTQQRTSSAKYNLKEYSSAIDYASRALALSKQIGDEIGMFDASTFLQSCTGRLITTRSH